MVKCSFFITNVCYVFSNVNGIEKPDKYRQKNLTLFNAIARSTCCNISLNIMITRQKYRMANILNSVYFFQKFGSTRKQKQKPLEAKDLNLLKETIQLSVFAQKKHFSYIIDKIVSLRRNFSKALVTMHWFLWDLRFPS